jgi:hypothetical protein
MQTVNNVIYENQTLQEFHWKGDNGNTVMWYAAVREYRIPYDASCLFCEAVTAK